MKTTNKIDGIMGLFLFAIASVPSVHTPHWVDAFTAFMGGALFCKSLIAYLKTRGLDFSD